MLIGNNIGISNSYQNTTIKSSGYKNVREYSNYLTNKFACLTPGKNVAVSITPGLLRKAMGDDKTGQWLEKELGNVAGYVEKAQKAAIAHGSKLTSVSIEFGEEYSTMTTVGVFGDEGESNSEIDKWLEKIKENKEEQKKLEERVKAQNTEYSYTFKGKDLKSITDDFIKTLSAANSTLSSMSGFDMKV